MKKLLSLMLALAVVLSLGAFAFAADSYTVELVNGMDGSVVETVEVAAGEDLVFSISCAAPADMGPTAPGEDGSGVVATSGTITYSNITTGGPNAYPTAETVTVSGITADATVTITPNPDEADGEFPTVTLGEAAGSASGEASGEASDEPYPMFDEYKAYLLETLLQDSFWQGNQELLEADLAAAETPDDENIQHFTGSGEVDQAPAGIEFPMTYDEWYAVNGPSDEPSGEASGEATAELADEVHIDGVDVMGAFSIDVDVTFADQGNGVKSFVIAFEGNSIPGTIAQGVWTPDTGDANEQGICSSVQAAYEAMTGAGGN